MSEKLMNLIDLVKSQADILKEDFKFTRTQEDDINKLIDDIYANNFETTKKQGDALEDLTSIIFNVHKLYDIKRNVRTSTNEIDLKFRLSDIGFLMKNNTNYYLEEEFLVECKNYSTPVSVTYIGKFSSLMRVSRIKQGIFISKKGLTGGNDRKRDSKGLIKKIALRDASYILDFELSDFKNLAGKSLQEILFAKRESLRLDVEFDDLIEHHNLESEFEE
ncbi:restriction endonuclease [Lactococcus lactis]|uniref:restriction endonuclease n=1 Tax=Lactococcus lactis TaxID=1358 RepID=UPI002078530D|nr:restriction endonuclease [Lactococcus lactis]USI47170.1 restriction endonuclease [Lactococcus lactis]